MCCALMGFGEERAYVGACRYPGFLGGALSGEATDVRTHRSRVLRLPALVEPGALFCRIPCELKEAT